MFSLKGAGGDPSRPAYTNDKLTALNAPGEISHTLDYGTYDLPVSVNIGTLKLVSYTANCIYDTYCRPTTLTYEDVDKHRNTGGMVLCGLAKAAEATLPLPPIGGMSVYEKGKIIWSCSLSEMGLI